MSEESGMTVVVPADFVNGGSQERGWVPSSWEISRKRLKARGAVPSAPPLRPGWRSWNDEAPPSKGSGKQGLNFGELSNQTFPPRGPLAEETFLIGAELGRGKEHPKWPVHTTHGFLILQVFLDLVLQCSQFTGLKFETGRWVKW